MQHHNSQNQDSSHLPKDGSGSPRVPWYKRRSIIVWGYIVSAFLVIGATSYFMWPINNNNADSFAKTAGVLTTLLVGIMASHIAILNAGFNAEFNAKTLERLEDIRKQNSKELGKLQGEITLSINKATERFKTDLAKEMEEYREYVRKKSEAYDHTDGAANEYFRTLQGVKDNIWDSQKADEVYKKMTESEKYLSLLPTDYENAWYLLVQHGKEIIARCKQEKPLPLDRIWQIEEQGFLAAYNRLREEAAKRRQIKSDGVATM